MTTTFRLQHDLRMRYTTLLQLRATMGLTADEATELALLRAQVTAFEAPMYAAFGGPFTAGVGVDTLPLVAKEP